MVALRIVLVEPVNGAAVFCLLGAVGKWLGASDLRMLLWTLLLPVLLLLPLLNGCLVENGTLVFTFGTHVGRIGGTPGLDGASVNTDAGCLVVGDELVGTGAWDAPRLVGTGEAIGLAVDGKIVGRAVRGRIFELDFVGEDVGLDVGEETIGLAVTWETVGLDVGAEAMGLAVTGETVGRDVGEDIIGLVVTGETV
jgi:hypothetical protein